jgi:hypothetical protein
MGFRVVEARTAPFQQTLEGRKDRGFVIDADDQDSFLPRVAPCPSWFPSFASSAGGGPRAPSFPTSNRTSRWGPRGP